MALCTRLISGLKKTYEHKNMDKQLQTEQNFIHREVRVLSVGVLLGCQLSGGMESELFEVGNEEVNAHMYTSPIIRLVLFLDLSFDSCLFTVMMGYICY